jgi:uncharacterized protein (TIGR02145 family)
MNSKLAKLALTAAFGLAITFTFTACEDKEKEKKQTTVETVTAEELTAMHKVSPEEAAAVAAAAAIEAKSAKAEAEREATRAAYIKANGGTFTDSRDKKTYKIIKIGTQVWFAENLNYKEEGSMCYDDKPDNCNKYGRLYNWETAKTACPSGWHLPSKNEWKVLEEVVGEETAGSDLKSTSFNGTDNYGFSAMLGGYKDFGCDCDDGFRGGYLNIEDEGYWWSTSENGSFSAYILRATLLFSNVSYEGEKSFGGGYGAKWDWLSVRCIKGDAKEADAKEAEAKEAAAKEAAAIAAAAAKAPLKAEAVVKGTFTDPRDKKTYKTVKIDEKVWMAENLNYEEKGSMCYANAPASCYVYGRLYNWDMAKTACPKGWHLPSNTEWELLIAVVGGKETAGKRLKSTGSWVDYNGKSGNGDDKYSFSALPGGGGDSDGSFYHIGIRGYWWSRESDGSNAYYKRMDHSEDEVENDSNGKKFFFCSVRCVQD